MCEVEYKIEVMITMGSTLVHPRASLALSSLSGGELEIKVCSGMGIAYIVWSGHLSGAEKFTYSLGLAQRKLGHEVAVMRLSR